MEGPDRAGAEDEAAFLERLGEAPEAVDLGVDGGRGGLRRARPKRLGLAHEVRRRIVVGALLQRPLHPQDLGLELAERDLLIAPELREGRSLLPQALNLVLRADHLVEGLLPAGDRLLGLGELSADALEVSLGPCELALGRADLRLALLELGRDARELRALRLERLDLAAEPLDLRAGGLGGLHSLLRRLAGLLLALAQALDHGLPAFGLLLRGDGARLQFAERRRCLLKLGLDGREVRVEAVRDLLLLGLLRGEALHLGCELLMHLAHEAHLVLGGGKLAAGAGGLLERVARRGELRFN